MTLVSRSPETNQIEARIPLAFIPVSTRDPDDGRAGSGGRTLVEQWVPKLRSAGLSNLVLGVVDRDASPTRVQGVFYGTRYAIENYLLDPLIAAACLVDAGHTNSFGGFKLELGDEHQLRLASSEAVTQIVNWFDLQLRSHLDLNPSDIAPTRVTYAVPPVGVDFPGYLIERRGKDLMQAARQAFDGRIINESNLLKAWRRARTLPSDLVTLLAQLQKGST